MTLGCRGVDAGCFVGEAASFASRHFARVHVYCLDGAAIADLAGMPVKYYDGLHNGWWNDATPFPCTKGSRVWLSLVPTR